MALLAPKVSPATALDKSFTPSAMAGFLLPEQSGEHSWQLRLTHDL